MMDTLYIRWDNGRGSMTVNLDRFFPTAKKNLKTLLSVIDLDWEHESELKEKLKVYFQEKKAECGREKAYSAKMYLDNRQEEVDSKEIVATRKRPNGVPLSKDELEEERKKLIKYRKYAAIHLSDYKRYKREEKQFSEYLKLL